MGKELERYGGDMGMEGTRARRGHGYGRDMDMEGIWVWKRHGYGGDKRMDGDMGMEGTMV